MLHMVLHVLLVQQHRKAGRAHACQIFVQQQQQSVRAENKIQTAKKMFPAFFLDT